MKVLRSCLYAILALAVFASCEKDNGKDNGKDDDGKPVQKLVKSIYGDEEDFTMSFEYDKNGRIIRTKKTWTDNINNNNWEITDIAYKDNMIIETFTDYDDYMYVIVYHLDDNGYVIKTEFKYKSYTEEDTYEYENGKIVKMEGEHNDSPEKRAYQWQGNDIITADWISDGYTFNFKYSNVVDNFNVDIVALLAPRLYGITEGFSMIKFKGATSEHLFHRIDYDGEYDGEIGFSYELDSDGYVKTINLDEMGSGEYVPWYHIEYIE